MNELQEREVRDAAAERLFEAALEELLADERELSRGSASRGVALDSPPAVKRGHDRWLAAALVLFAVAVTIGTVFLARDPGWHAMQDPVVPLPPTRTVDGEPGLLALDPSAQNIFIRNAMPRDLAHLRRFEQLRCVRMNARFSAGGEQAWRNAPPSVLAPLRELADLEVLGIPFPMTITPAHLEVLRGCERLRAISFSGRIVQLDRGVAEELARWPRLRRLRLNAVPVSVEGLEGLAAVSGLRRLELSGCDGFDAAALEAISKVTQLEALGLGGLGPERDVLPGTPPRDGYAPSPDDLACLAELQQLRSLRLSGLVWTEAHVEALPVGLEQLTVSSPEPLAPAMVAALRRLGSLRVLHFGRVYGSPEEIAAAENAAAATLATLRLEEFSWSNPPGSGLLDAVAAQPALREAGFAWTEGVELERLARAPSLEALELVLRWRSWRASEPPPEFDIERREVTLRGLAKSRSLRRILFWASTVAPADEARLRAVCGPELQLDLRR